MDFVYDAKCSFPGIVHIHIPLFHWFTGEFHFGRVTFIAQICQLWYDTIEHIVLLINEVTTQCMTWCIRHDVVLHSTIQCSTVKMQWNTISFHSLRYGIITEGVTLNYRICKCYDLKWCSEIWRIDMQSNTIKCCRMH